MARWMSVDGPVKIGMTSDLERRLREIQMYSPYEVVMERVIKTEHKQIARMFEHALHHELRPYHMRGEWFLDEPEVGVIFKKYQDDGYAAVAASGC